MRYAIFSDVHANLEAYQACLEAMEALKVDRYICLGDVVGYGANPKECIATTRRLIDEKGCVCVVGNHDAATTEMTAIRNFNTFAQQAIVWTRKVIDEADNDFLSTLSFLRRENDFVLVHASMDRPEEWHYVYTLDDAYKNFEILKEKICFVGHSHIPVIFRAGRQFEYFVSNFVKIDRESRYIINVGSIGQPRDHNPAACFVIYDEEQASLEYKRVRYDIAKAQSKIVQAGLPEILAIRLAIGE